MFFLLVTKFKILEVFLLTPKLLKDLNPYIINNEKGSRRTVSYVLGSFCKFI